jgi:hypothetical protein
MSRDTDNAMSVRVSFEAMLGKLTDTMGSVTDGLNKIHTWMTANPVRTPVLRPILGSYTAAASALTYGFMNCGGPPAGWRREIRWFAVWGADPFTTITGNYVALIAGDGQYQDNSTEPAGFTQIVTTSLAIPSRFTASSNELTLLPGQRLILMFKSLGNNVAVNCFGMAWDYKESTIVSEPM